MFTTFLSELDQSTPRYTSYPPATYFNKDITSQHYIDWIQEIEGDLSLYVHIPFCQALCWFCGCHTKVPGNYDAATDYLTSLYKEIEIVADLVPATCCITHLHFGGGTPTFLKSSDLEMLFKNLFQNFQMTKEVTIDMEIDPRTVKEDLVCLIGELGVNRVSLGVQDFDPKVQEAIGRIQPFELVEDTLYRLRQKGIVHVNLDMMYGLPLQTEKSIEENVKKVLKLAPDRCAFFGYGHVPWMKPHQKKLEIYQLPDSLERYKQFSRAKYLFNASGYESIGIDHFALPGDSLLLAAKSKRMKRNFQGYTSDQANAVIGLGASAVTQVPKGYLQNNSVTKAYKEALNVQKTLPIGRGFAFSTEDQIRGEIISHLMCFFEADLSDICGTPRLAQEYMKGAYQTLHLYEREGLVTIKDLKITICEEARYLTRLIAKSFDDFSPHTKRIDKDIKIKRAKG